MTATTAFARTAALLAAPAAFAAYPEKTMTIVVPFPPGGSTDVIARTLRLDLRDVQRGDPRGVQLRLHVGRQPARRGHALPRVHAVANTPEQMATFQADEFARWKGVIETGKITADRAR